MGVSVAWIRRGWRIRATEPDGFAVAFDFDLPSARRAAQEQFHLARGSVERMPLTAVTVGGAQAGARKQVRVAPDAERTPCMRPLAKTGNTCTCWPAPARWAG